MTKTFRSWDVDQGWLLPPSAAVSPLSGFASFSSSAIRVKTDSLSLQLCPPPCHGIGRRTCPDGGDLNLRFLWTAAVEGKIGSSSCLELLLTCRGIGIVEAALPLRDQIAYPLCWI